MFFQSKGNEKKMNYLLCSADRRVVSVVLSFLFFFFSAFYIENGGFNLHSSCSQKVSDSYVFSRTSSNIDLYSYTETFFCSAFGPDISTTQLKMGFLYARCCMYSLHVKNADFD